MNDQNKYPDVACGKQPVQAPEIPTVHLLLENIQVQINEIDNGKNEIVRSIHRLHDTNEPTADNNLNEDYSNDVVGTLNRFKDKLSSLREDFYSISNKLNDLI